MTENILSINEENRSLFLDIQNQIKAFLESNDIVKENSSIVTFNIEKIVQYVKNNIIPSSSNNQFSLYIYNSISLAPVIQFYILSNLYSHTTNFTIIEANVKETGKGSDVYWKNVLSYDLFVKITNLEDGFNIPIINDKNEGNVNKVYIFLV